LRVTAPISVFAGPSTIVCEGATMTSTCGPRPRTGTSSGPTSPSWRSRSTNARPIGSPIWPPGTDSRSSGSRSTAKASKPTDSHRDRSSTSPRISRPCPPDRPLAVSSAPDVRGLRGAGHSRSSEAVALTSPPTDHIPQITAEKKRNHRQMNLDFSFTDLSGTFSVMDVLLSLLLAFACSLVVAWLYRATDQCVSSSQCYVQPHIILGMLIALIMLIVASNIARAFALVGALSVVIFRNAIKESRVVGLIFLALRIGMAGGTCFYTLA